MVALPTSSKILLTCCDCGAHRSVFPSQISGPSARLRLSNGVYRCRPCWNVKRKDVRINPRIADTTLTCSHCGKTRKATPIELREAANPYHCRSCYHAKRRQGALPQLRGGPVAVTCPTCGVQRMVKRSQANKLSGYCSSCARKGEKSGAWKGGDVTLTCVSCKSQKSVRRNRVSHYCRKNGDYYCRACGLQNKPEGEQSPTWQGGKSFEPYPTDWTPKLRRLIRERDNYQCQICGEGQTSRKMPVHHIDYDKNNCSPENLIALCGSCHPKTNFRRDHWEILLSAKMSERLK